MKRAANSRGMRARRGRGGQEPREDRLVRGVGEAARGVPLLPDAARQVAGQMRDASGGGQFGRDVVPQGVQGDEQQVVAAHDLAHVGVGAVRGAVLRGWC